MTALPKPTETPFDHRSFTVEEVLRMVEAGILGADEPVELIEGQLAQVTPQGSIHTTLLGIAQDLLTSAYSGHGIVRVQSPLEAGPDSLPEPDLCIVSGGRLDYLKHHPTGSHAILAVEFSKTSHSLDRYKAKVYSRARVPVYWLVDLVDSRIEVYRDPSPDGYGHIEILGMGKQIELPRLDRKVDVDTFFGRN